MSSLIEHVIDAIKRRLDFENPLSPGRSIDEILSNREDKKIIDDTVYFLKDNPDVKNKKVVLSQGEELIISIE